MDKKAARLLKDRDLKITTQRLSILSILLINTSKAFSLSELLECLKHKMNRSTVYRSLETLLKNELISQLVDVNGDAIYVLNSEQRCEQTLHPHLKCYNCGTLECLPAFPANYVSKLQNFGVDRLNVVLKGVCSNCSKNK